LPKFDLTDGLHPNESNLSKRFYFHPNLNEAFLICPDLIVGPYPNAPNLLKYFSFYPKLELIFLVGLNLMTAIRITTWFQFTKGSVYFATKGKKEWRNSPRLFRFSPRLNGKIVLVLQKIALYSRICLTRHLKGIRKK